MTITPLQAFFLGASLAVFIFAAYFWLVDNIIGHGVDLLLKHLAVSK